jgi:solute carrier family 25 uncoupling protein 8/9
MVILISSSYEPSTSFISSAKVRMQLQASAKQSLSNDVLAYKGTFDALRRISAEEGFLALYKGLFPGLQRQMLFAGTRISLYEPVRDFYHEGGGNPPLLKKILAGLTTGAIGITIASPTCVIHLFTHFFFSDCLHIFLVSFL